MELKRFFASLSDNGKILLTKDEFYHAVKVTRHKVGFDFIASIGDKYDYFAKITHIDKVFLLADIIDKKENTNEPSKNLILFLALCKEFDFIVQKAVELGVTKIYPVITKRSQNINFNKERLDKIITGAAKQSCRAIVPTLNEPIDFVDAIKTAKDAEICIFCYEKCQNSSVFDAVNDDPKSVSLFIGSEGGFEDYEAEIAKENGLKLVSLGKRILRAETAAISAMTLVMTKLGEM